MSFWNENKKDYGILPWLLEQLKKDNIIDDETELVIPIAPEITKVGKYTGIEKAEPSRLSPELIGKAQK